MTDKVPECFSTLLPICASICHQGWRSRGPASISRPASRPNSNGLGLGLGLGCPCLGLGRGLGGPGLDYNPGSHVSDVKFYHPSYKMLVLELCVE